jgi:hypothetical protein
MELFKVRGDAGSSFTNDFDFAADPFDGEVVTAEGFKVVTLGMMEDKLDRLKNMLKIGLIIGHRVG